MTKPKVSIIMPVFNTEQYVNEALMSIVNQTLKEIEIIVINDGSTDGSLEVISRIAENDNRVQIYSQENQGQSVARNLGISIAKGEYIYFMDSDDLLDLDALECCYNKCEAESLDFVFFDADIINHKNEYNISFNYDRNKTANKNHLYNGKEILSKQLESYCYSASPCLSFINKKFLDFNNLKYYPKIIHEDQLFTVLLYLNAKKVMYISKSFFKRRLRDNSTMTKKITYKNMNGYFTVATQIISYAKYQNTDTKIIIDKYLNITLNAAVYNAHDLNFIDKLKVLKNIIRYYWKYVSLKNLLVLFFK